ncbi:MAG: RNA 2'-phosphotransferase [Polyangiaceae bacterium]
MTPEARRKKSKLLSFLLRHRPDMVGLRLDAGGWLGCTELLEAIAREGFSLTEEELREVVATSDKARFEMSADGKRVRAVQGHSVDVELGYRAETPPELLFHGTSAGAVPSILRSGLDPRSRVHVHLSPDRASAEIVARRRSTPVVLIVHAGDMARAGHELFRAPNGVWLTKRVPPAFISER